MLDIDAVIAFISISNKFPTEDNNECKKLLIKDSAQVLLKKSGQNIEEQIKLWKSNSPKFKSNSILSEI